MHIWDYNLTALLTEFSANLQLNTAVFELEEDYLSRSVWLLTLPCPNILPSLGPFSNGSYSSQFGMPCPIPSMASILGPEATSLHSLI
jgi:hypothetical protein